MFGSIGPGTRLPTLGQVDYDAVEDAIADPDAPASSPAALTLLSSKPFRTCSRRKPPSMARVARWRKRETDIPIVAQVTVESTGTLLVGADIAAAEHGASFT